MRPLRFLFAALFSVALSLPAHAQLKVDVTSGMQDPLPIALPDPVSSDAQATQIGRDIFRVVAADLERSGLFRPIDKSAFIQQITDGNAQPDFASWRQINAQALVTGSAVSVGGGKVKVSFRLWDTLAGQQMTGKEFNTFEGNWRRVAHLMADEIYKRITGEAGYFDTRIVYVAESGPTLKRVKRLAIMDQDGENHKFLTDGRSLVLTPRFSPNSQEILYLSFSGREPRVFLRDLQTGREEAVGRFEGMSFAPRFNNDGNRMVMSIAANGNTDIYEMDLRSRNLRKLTDHVGIDTSPSYSPDGQKIVFNSDRGGKPQLYVMNADGSGVTRISFGSGSYSAPVWSPRGDFIAFTKQDGGQFSIGVMKSDGSGERIVSGSFLDEGPSWAPNGRVIVFSRGGKSSRSGAAGSSRLYSIDVTGRNLRQIVTPLDASDPAWSPLLPM